MSRPRAEIHIKGRRESQSVMIRSISRTTTAVTTTTSTGASRVRPKRRSSGVTVGSVMPVAILTLTSLRHSGGDGCYAAGGHVRDDAGHDPDKQRRRGEQTNRQPLAPDGIAQGAPLVEQRPKKHRTDPPQDVPGGDRNRTHAQDRSQRVDAVTADERGELGDEPGQRG